MTAQNRNMFFLAGQGISVCSLPAQPQPVAAVQALLLPRVCITVLGSLPKVGGVCPRSCFPENLLPLWPHHPIQTQIWMLWIKPHRVSNTAGLIALFSTENWIQTIPTSITVMFPHILPDSCCSFCDLPCCESPRRRFSPRAPATLTRHEAAVREVVLVTRVG